MRIIRYLPGLRTIVVTMVVCLLLGFVMVGGFHPKALLALAFGVAYIALLAIRNYDPNGYEAFHEPKAYSYRQERDKLFRILGQLTDAVEANHATAASDVLTRHVQEARKVLDDIAGREAHT